MNAKLETVTTHLPGLRYALRRRPRRMKLRIRVTSQMTRKITPRKKRHWKIHDTATARESVRLCSGLQVIIKLKGFAQVSETTPFCGGLSCCIAAPKLSHRLLYFLDHYHFQSSFLSRDVQRSLLESEVSSTIEKASADLIPTQRRHPLFNSPTL